MAREQTTFRWTPHRDPYEVARAAFKVSYMSNANWRKVLAAIAAADLDVRRSIWKFMEAEHPTVNDRRMPALHHVLPSGLGDIAIGPVEYKWIEWIHFPRTWHPIPGVGHTASQDLEGLKRVL